ncbi:histidine phosphatase superfamily [Chaetomium fimeti]|uniref:Phytase A n=1 Tax=Chaetomium fimeti TaxID=1854472 RepID=A0AAE0HCU1_9PEZI|nr:histidine phosphatase superfamily [Chaetomium fimeti]
MMASLMNWFRKGPSGYAPLLDQSASNGGLGQGTRPRWTRRATKLAGLALMVVLVGFATVVFMQRGPLKCDDTPDRGYLCGTPIYHYWGQYSPYYSVPSEIDPSIPDDCELTFAQVLSRHGARAPTFTRSVHYRLIVARIYDAKSYGPGFEFLRDYKYRLGADQLTPMGQQQMVNSGLKFYHRYRSLARKSPPFVRAGGQDRVVHSAQNFTQGFHAALLADPESTARPRLPYDMVVIPETATTNNTLHHSLCDAFERGRYATIGRAAQKAYLTTFAAPITARINANLAIRGDPFDDRDTIALMDLCPFETVASPGGAVPAPFCRLFTPAEWRHYDYYQSLEKWYGYGPGNPLGPTQGVGFVNELLARLTRTPVADGTSTNRTLDADRETFPLDRALYADFSHDNDMMGVLGALGVYDGVAMLDNSTRQEPEESGGYAAGWAVPFGARVYVEKMRCGVKGEKGEGAEEGEEEGEEMVRVLVNDRVMKLSRCGADHRGMCTLGRFVESMEFARGDGRWDLCF